MDNLSKVSTELSVEQKLKRERAILQYVVDNIPYCIFWKDRDSVYLGCNKNFAGLDGRSDPMELVGKTDFDMAWKAHAAQYREFDRATMAAGEPILNREEISHDDKGREMVILTSKVPLRSEAGDVIGLLGIIVDITDRKRIEVELAQARDAAEQAARAKSDFMANISHELRTPLTLVLGPIQALLAGETGALPDAVRQELERTRRNCARLSNLVNDLLDFSKLEAGKVEVVWEAVDANELLGFLIEDAQPVARARGLTLAFQNELGPARLPLDRRMFEKIALNLIGNALKFTPAGGRVDVTLRAAGERFELSVKDTGIGIPAERRHVLFERFEQVDPSATRRYEGTGLGLSLVKELSLAMGGEVGVESEEGRGSRFFALFPRSRDSLVMQARAGAPEARAGGPSAELLALVPVEMTPAQSASPELAVRVLVAEDNPDMRSHLRDLLCKEYEVISVEDGEQALAAARKYRPEVILSDVMMPKMDGNRLVQELKADERLRHVPVILLTARAGTDEIVHGLEGGADDYLAKPFSPLELRARVRAAHRLYRAHQEMTLLADELVQSRDLAVQVERLAMAAEWGGVAGEAGLPSQQPPERVDLSAVIERAISAKGSGVVAEKPAVPVTATVAPSDLELALQKLFAFLGREASTPAPVSVAVEVGKKGIPCIRARRAGWNPPAGDDAVFRPRLTREGAEGKPRVDLDLTVARALTLRNDGRLSIERDAHGAGFRLELPPSD